MKSGTILILAGASLFALAACQSTEPVLEPAQAPAPDMALVEPATAPATEPDEPGAEMEGEIGEAIPDCPVLETANWVAYINSMPGPDAVPMLQVIGQVTLPTPGYSFAWREGKMDRSAVPAIHLILDITPPGPNEMVMQVLTTETISYKTEALSSGYSKVVIVCNDAPLAEITRIDEVS